MRLRSKSKQSNSPAVPLSCPFKNDDGSNGTIETVMMMISSSVIQHKHEAHCRITEQFAHQCDFLLFGFPFGCWMLYAVLLWLIAPCHLVDGLFVVAHIIENFNQSYESVMWIKWEFAVYFEAAYTQNKNNSRTTNEEWNVVQEIRRRKIYMCISPLGAMRWLGFCKCTWCQLVFKCLASILKCCVYSHPVKFTWNKPHHFMHTNARSPTQPIHKYSVAVLSFHQFITDRAVIWMDLFEIASHRILLMDSLFWTHIFCDVGFAVSEIQWMIKFGKKFFCENN